MMTETVQRGCAQDAVPNLEELMKLTEDREKEQIREQEFMKNREIQLWHDRRDAQRTRRIVRDQLIRRWARHTTVNNSCNVLSLYKLRF
ncbi:MAG: hypothetical protein IH838_12910 [Proteobacteria bacterium]|nr:hypothetical protein [Pseudomonadota bacterium]